MKLRLSLTLRLMLLIFIASIQNQNLGILYLLSLFGLIQYLPYWMVLCLSQQGMGDTLHPINHWMEKPEEIFSDLGWKDDFIYYFYSFNSSPCSGWFSRTGSSNRVGVSPLEATFTLLKKSLNSQIKAKDSKAIFILL